MNISSILRWFVDSSYYDSYVQGSYSELTDARIKALTQEELLDTVNNKNVSGIFMKVELLQFDI